MKDRLFRKGKAKKKKRTRGDADLDGLLEVDLERVAGAVGEELFVVAGQDAAEAFQFDADAVVGGAVGRAVQAEADDEDALVDAELDRVAPAAVAPLSRKHIWLIVLVISCCLFFFRGGGTFRSCFLQFSL